MDRLLITRGDDFGSFQEANLAIIDSFTRGVLRNASIMAPAPHFAHAAALARAHPDLCLGLHLALTSEWEDVRFGPVLSPQEVPSLVESDGTFLPSPMHHHERGVQLDEMMRELKAQLAKARQAGLHIQYLDEHMGVGWVHPLPRGSERLADRIRVWAREEGLLWHTDLHEERGFHPLLQRPWTVAQAMEALPRLAQAPSLFMTHPAYHRGPLTQLRSHAQPNLDLRQEGADREDDARVLQSLDFARACEANGVRCVSYMEAARTIGHSPRTRRER